MEIQWSLVLFTAVAGCGTWASVGVAVDELRGLTERTNRLASAVALVLAVVGGIASVTHLSHPDRIMAVLGHPTPGIFLEALLIGLFILAEVVYLILLARGVSAGVRKAVAVAAAVIGVVFSFASGYSYMMEARPTWNTIALPFGYLGFAAASGLALYLLLAALKKERDEALKLAGIETVVGGVLAIASGLAFGFACMRRCGACGVRVACLQQAGIDARAWGCCVCGRHRRLGRFPRRHVDGGHGGGQLFRNRAVATLARWGLCATWAAASTCRGWSRGQAASAFLSRRRA